MNRREYVSVVGTTTLTGIAGCMGTLGSLDDPSEETQTPPSNEDLPVTDEKAMQVGADIQPAVVKLQTSGGKDIGGTGWFFDDSTIITNAHLARRSDSFQVETFAGNTYEAERLGMVQSMAPDIAALSITPPETRSYTTLSTQSSSTLERADPLVQVGHPGSIGFWVISLGAYLTPHENHPWMLSTVPTLRGNSGSPVVSIKGKVVGLTSGETWDDSDLKDYREIENTVYRRYPNTAKTTHVPIEVVEERLADWR